MKMAIKKCTQRDYTMGFKLPLRTRERSSLNVTSRSQKQIKQYEKYISGFVKAPITIEKYGGGVCTVHGL